ncbi:MAG: hypothetical protein GY696_24330 [Gammaproteobacteria bacterium]|nr:hypothetical protein [Gammaproteobacteria bacterium]
MDSIEVAVAAVGILEGTEQEVVDNLEDIGQVVAGIPVGTAELGRTVDAGVGTAAAVVGNIEVQLEQAGQEGSKRVELA